MGEMTLTEFLAVMAMMVWPVVPLFWVPVHGCPRFFKNLGLMTYTLPLITWLPLAYGVYRHRELLLKFKLVLPAPVVVSGTVLLLAGLMLNVWTVLLLSLRGIMGLPEISPKFAGRLTTSGPFSVVRHPTYLGHAIMLSGVFLISGVMAVAVLICIDLVLVNLVIIPLEERELLSRFGDDYKKYKERVPGFFPRMRRQ
jgi:protein-S-isoprenylcysteine O-methyltransferase Ste14